MFQGHVTIAKILIDQQADIYCRDAIDLAACHYAIDGGHLAAITFIFDMQFASIKDIGLSNPVSLASCLWRAGKSYLISKVK